MALEWTMLPAPLDLLGECPIWERATQTFYWTDIAGKALKSWGHRSGEYRAWPMPDEVGSFALRRQGGAILAMRSGFALFDFATGTLQPLRSPDFDRSTTRFNDGRCGPDGRFYAGTMYEPRGRPEGRLYRLDTDLTWTELPGTDAVVSNGLAFSPDGKIMYHSDSPSRIINAHDFDAATGNIGPGRIFATVPRPEEAGGVQYGWPDGAAIDAEGYYWSAMYAGQRIVRFAPDGSIDREFPFPTRCPTMICFGGEHLDTLFVTSSRNNRPAAELAQQPDAGKVFMAKVDVPGVEEPKFGG